MKFDTFPISRIRRNHALEHATLNVLAAQGIGAHLAGFSDTRGFWIVGDIPTETLHAAAQRALTRLRKGESSLAIHKGCGTNYVASGAVAGTFAWVGMADAPRSFRGKMDRLPVVILLTTLGLMLAQPLGPWLQRKVTTDAEPGKLRITEITYFPGSTFPLHRIRTSG